MIPGTRRAKYLEENLNAAKVTISAAENKEIRDYLATFNVSGER